MSQFQCICELFTVYCLCFDHEHGHDFVKKRHQPISYSNRREFHLKMSLLRRFRSFWGFNSQRWRQLPKVRSKKNHNKNPPCLCALCCFNVFLHMHVFEPGRFLEKTEKSPISVKQPCLPSKTWRILPVTPSYWH